MKTKSIEQVHRVVRLPSPLVEAMRRRRDATGATSLLFVADATAKHLPRIVEALRKLGLIPRKGTKKAVRLPFSSQAGTLKNLRSASDQTGLTVLQLLSLCLFAATAVAPAPSTHGAGAAKPKVRRGPTRRP